MKVSKTPQSFKCIATTGEEIQAQSIFPRLLVSKLTNTNLAIRIPQNCLCFLAHTPARLLSKNQICWWFVLTARFGCPNLQRHKSSELKRNVANLGVEPGFPPPPPSPAPTPPSFLAQDRAHLRYPALRQHEGTQAKVWSASFRK